MTLTATCSTILLPAGLAMLFRDSPGSPPQAPTYTLTLTCMYTFIQTHTPQTFILTPEHCTPCSQVQRPLVSHPQGFLPYHTLSERMREGQDQTCTPEPRPQNTDLPSYTKPSLLNEWSNPSATATSCAHCLSPCIRLLHLLLTPRFYVLVKQCNPHSNLGSQELHF